MTLRFLFRSTLFLLSVIAVKHAGAQAARPLWNDVSDASVRTAKTRNNSVQNRTVIPLFYRTLQLDRAALETQLQAAPVEFSVPMEISPEIEIPLPDGTMGRFNLQESPIMAPELAAKFPEIKTYVGQGIDDPTATIRMDLTPRGFHAIILSPAGEVYLDPYWRDDDSTYVSYYKKDFVADKPFRCLVESNEKSKRQEAKSDNNGVARPSGASLRIYRLAMACDGEYAAAVCAPNPVTLSRTLAAIVTSVNRCSGIYERDLAVRFSLVANNDQIVYLDGNTDPYTNDDTALDENQDVIDSVIGSANYDIGHVFTTGAGGVAYLGVVCTGSKAGGTTGTSNPIGDPYDVDYVVHEMGHQFGGDHTFNGTANNCGGGNRTGTNAYETDSGITIMAYAGICASATVNQNLAAHSDDYFHTASYTQIDDFTTLDSGSSCPVTVATGNSPPVIGALSDHTIPVSTPFTLTASATDADGDTLTYCWEEYDRGTSQNTAAPSATSTTAPIFRSFPPTKDTARTFPSLTYILNNSNNPPAIVGSFATGEIMTTVVRTMNYRVTVRDNHAGGGGSNWALTHVTTANAAAGAFALTSFNSATTVAGSSTQTVTWNVASSNLAPVNCANVKISLSTDGGNTFPNVLAASVPNNGSALVTIPEIATTQGRIKVEAVGNIFFDISDANFTITSSNNPPTLSVSNSITVARGTPTATVATVATAGDLDGDALSVSVSNLPYRATVTPTIVGNSISLSALVECTLTTTLTSRTYPITLTVTDSHGATVAGTVNLIVTPNLTPVFGSYPNLSVPQAGSGTSTPTSITDANGNLAPAPFTITPTALPGGGTISVDQSTGAISAITTAGTTTGSPTTVRVTAIDSCGAAAITTLSITVFSGNPAASYLGGYGLSGGNAAFSFDYDGDGILNLMEYALRLDPTKASRAGLPVVIAKDYAGTRYLSMTFTRSAVASDVTYIVEGSSDLSSWSTLASSTGGATTSGPGFVAETGSAPNFTAEVRDTVPIDAATTPRFLRLRVTSP